MVHMTLRIARPMRRPSSRAAYFRQRVPQDLLTAVKGQKLVVQLPPVSPDHDPTIVTTQPNAEVKFSLQVDDRHPAFQRRHAAALAQVAAYFEALRNGPAPLTPKQRVALSGEIYKLWAQTLEDDPHLTAEQWTRIAEAQEADFTGDDLALLLMSDAERRQERIRRLEKRYGKLLNWVLAQHALVVATEDRLKLLEQVAKDAPAASRKLARNADGDYSEDAYAQRFPKLDLKSAAVPAAPALTWESLITNWTRVNAPREATIRQWRRIIEKFAAFIGKDNPADVTASDVRRWRDHLLDQEGLSPKGVNNTQLAALNAIFGAAVREDLLKINPAAKTSVTVKAQPHQAMQHISDEEAATILSAALKETKPLRRWGPWILAQSGARVGEVCQLTGQDVDEEQGIPFFWIRREVKTPNAHRRVPIHPELVRQGFLKYARERGAKPLFYEPEKRKGARPHKVLSKDLANWISGLGLDIGRKEHRKDPNHGWRHRVVEILKSQERPTYVIQALIGQSTGNVTERYGSVSLSTLYRAVQTIPLPIAPSA